MEGIIVQQHGQQGWNEGNKEEGEEEEEEEGSASVQVL